MDEIINLIKDLGFPMVAFLLVYLDLRSKIDKLIGVVEKWQNISLRALS